MTTHTPLRLPESMTRTDVGPYLRGLREHFALTMQDVSERIHIRVRYLQAMEQSQFEQMPGQAYARGYVHSYAEFLGLDADQVVALCFADVPPTAQQQKHYKPTAAISARGLSLAQWRGMGIAALVVAVILLVVAQVQMRQAAQEEDLTTVAEVPETMLNGLRTEVMATPSNYACLSDASALACFVAADSWQWLVTYLTPEPLYFAEAAYAPDADDTPDGEMP